MHHIKSEIKEPVRQGQGQMRWFLAIVFGGLVLAAILALGYTRRNYHNPVHRGLIADGIIQFVDDERCVLAPINPGQPVLFFYNSMTKFRQSGLPAKPDNLEAGKSVRVHYHLENNRLVAEQIDTPI